MANPLYPEDLDYFREYLDSGTDHLFEQDLTDYFTLVVAIQNHLGPKPSGTKGTVWSRLFENGNMEAVSGAGGWRPLKWDSQHRVPSSHRFERNESGFAIRVDFNTSQFEGQDTIFGDDTPCAFAQLQKPIDTPEGASGANGRGGAPWRTGMSYITHNVVAWVGVDGEGDEMKVNGTGQSCDWGYLIWNLVTQGNPKGTEV